MARTAIIPCRAKENLGVLATIGCLLSPFFVSLLHFSRSPSHSLADGHLRLRYRLRVRPISPNRLITYGRGVSSFAIRCRLAIQLLPETRVTGFTVEMSNSGFGDVIYFLKEAGAQENHKWHSSATISPRPALTRTSTSLRFVDVLPGAPYHLHGRHSHAAKVVAGETCPSPRSPEKTPDQENSSISRSRSDGSV